MKEKLLIVGAGGFGRVVSEHAVKKYECYFVDDGYEINDEVCGIKIVGKVSDLAELFGEFKLLVIAIGNNSVREKIYNTAKNIGYDLTNIIAENVYISPFAAVGKGCVFLNNVCIQNGACIGNGVLLNVGVEMHHDSKIDDFSLVYSNSVVRTFAKVGKRVKIGSNVTISNNADIADDEIIENGQTVMPFERV